MDGRPVVWERSNQEHLLEDHPERGITRGEVEEALTDGRRIEAAEERKGMTYRTVVGATLRGRLLVVVWVDHLRGRFPVHARQVGRQAARRYYR
jgi:hypothetical protein